ncbi:HAD hydrolase family protein [Dyadobacter chenhuakuii]|uniref:HAD hydrolase family protein n=1 Tax=Dyadobacter chenhuakuii TaxID=2909339 RepID=A0ABY4XLI5_9BACT|nr:HAD hydrolase family protein [Dyadobacter chenhuakuii]MCF2494099.1 HAD hydrolase family protein [Dyadobacter chenhuakuii]USJ31227.1 HAD hydrolase family protein [Dyadobacter chenhuakuii]
MHTQTEDLQQLDEKMRSDINDRFEAFSKEGYRVAYIGDGINDVAAINAADAGISTSNAVDAAKQAADVVLLEKDLSVLADGIQDRRKSFVNSMKWQLYMSWDMGL